MQVDGVILGNAYGLQNVNGNNKTPEGPPGQQPVSGEVPGPSVTTGKVGEQEFETGEDEKGVVRLLMEGHFKGVSDVRLRINFNDEITAIESAQMQALSADKMGGVLKSLGGFVDSFLTDNDLTEEEAAAVSDAKDSFLQAVNEADDPADAVADAFAAFLELLQGLIPPPPEPEPEDVPPDNEGGQDPETNGENEPAPPTDSGPDWQAFIENLQSSFSGAMDDLTTAVSAVSALPPLSEPSGNGVAYDKFLAIYNELRGIVPDTLNSAV